eukprot:CAMPEP_0174381746 /NCGR_PEP_ID=MMETSP0811_2-20130205/124216_1 /TAXON_ID=73025 ORGANISM="Eutreptiella gymnastica-like, Strain CCMP1594" /NCGR_SAMPLE_ID=MMETSP0811_2 /ASSEMBLY_ACC=CAM_ASM_000667 /LENGTH=725 /DNA_ID=CAMNT_0015534985 /DNA_START=29 /DNA_END=2203 /DNA_ORIENTATION=-
MDLRFAKSASYRPHTPLLLQEPRPTSNCGQWLLAAGILAVLAAGVNSCFTNNSPISASYTSPSLSTGVRAVATERVTPAPPSRSSTKPVSVQANVQRDFDKWDGGHTKTLATSTTGQGFSYLSVVLPVSCFCAVFLATGRLLAAQFSAGDTTNTTSSLALLSITGETSQPKTSGGGVHRMLQPPEEVKHEAFAPLKGFLQVTRAGTGAIVPFTFTPRKQRTVAMFGTVGLFYSTVTGNTETVAEYIQSEGGVEQAMDIADASADQIAGCDGLILGAPTWHTGADTERSGTAFDEWLYGDLETLDLTGKKVALFGLGDQDGYGDNFCDAVGELYDCLTARGATIIGLTSTDGYDHTESKAEREGKFLGLLCDETNQPDMSEDRVGAWMRQLKEEGMPFGDSVAMLTTTGTKQFQQPPQVEDPETVADRAQVIETAPVLWMDLPGVLAPTGFWDPLGLSGHRMKVRNTPRGTAPPSPQQIGYFREAELKHGRIAMLAAVGFPFAEKFHPLFGGDISAPSVSAFEQPPLQTFNGFVFAAIAVLEAGWFAECFDVADGIPSLKDGRQLGDYYGFDPLGLQPEDPESLRTLQNKELSNGRLAMLGIAGMVAQELVSHGKLFGDSVAMFSTTSVADRAQWIENYIARTSGATSAEGGMTPAPAPVLGMELPGELAPTGFWDPLGLSGWRMKVRNTPRGFAPANWLWSPQPPSPQQVGYFREAELKHGRIAM